jgi:hypothetical protein
MVTSSQSAMRTSCLVLGWEFQFLVPISGTPIVSGILILFLIPKIPVGFFLKFRCLESQKIGIPIPKFGILVPHKKTDTYSSVDTKVHGRKPSPYKTAGELFFPPYLHLLTLVGKQILHLLTLNGKRAIRVSRCRFGAKIIFPTKPTSTHSYGERTYIYSHLTENKQ